MRSEPARVGGISLDFVVIPPRRDENFLFKIFHMSTRKWASPARWDRVFFNQVFFVFQMLIR